MKICYIAGPYMGATHDGKSFYEISKNILEAREWAKRVIDAGAFAFVPHLNSYHMELDVEKSADWWREADLEILGRCDVVFLIPGWERSKGAKMEKEFAESRGIPMFFSLDLLRDWLRRTEADAISTKREAATPQKLPAGDGKDVAELVIADIRKFYTVPEAYPRNVGHLYGKLVNVAFYIKEKLCDSGTDLKAEIAKDIEARVAMGEKKYGTRLKTNNGRNAMLDAYQEILDALNYTRQEIEERYNEEKSNADENRNSATP